MICLESILSADGKTRKYVFRNDDGLILEFSYIDNGTGKDIVCVPTQTMCAMGCSFCHTSDFLGRIPVRPVTDVELVDGIEHVVRDMGIGESERTLLISYMGCGEPLENSDNVLGSMLAVMRADFTRSRNRRFALATCIPEGRYDVFPGFTEVVRQKGIKLKMHLSLHYTTDADRKKYMPASTSIADSIFYLETYNRLTGNAIEIHYSLMSGINDSEDDSMRLAKMLRGKRFNVKFLYHNKKDGVVWDNASLDTLHMFMARLQANGIECEYYVPPGLDIGASCGQFLMERYATVGSQYSRPNEEGE